MCTVSCSTVCWCMASGSLLSWVVWVSFPKIETAGLTSKIFGVDKEWSACCYSDVTLHTRWPCWCLPGGVTQEMQKACGAVRQTVEHPQNVCPVFCHGNHCLEGTCLTLASCPALWPCVWIMWPHVIMWQCVDHVTMCVDHVTSCVDHVTTCDHNVHLL